RSRSSTSSRCCWSRCCNPGCRRSPARARERRHQRFQPTEGGLRVAFFVAGRPRRRLLRRSMGRRRIGPLISHRRPARLTNGHAFMGLDLVSTGKNPPDEINVIIEIPKDAEPVKYEVDKETGAIFVDRVL